MKYNEKVLNALINCTEKPKCRECYWTDCESFECERISAPKSLLLASLSIVKESIPRIIEFDEIDNYEVLWLEVKDVNDESGLAPWVKTSSGQWFSPLECNEFVREMHLVSKEQYGKIARCWNHRPSQEQRKTKW